MVSLRKGRGQLFQRALLTPTQRRSEKFQRGGIITTFFQARFLRKN